MKRLLYLFFLVNFAMSAQIFKPILQFTAIPHSESFDKYKDATDWLIKKIKANETIPAGNYFISRTIVLDSPRTINMTGQGFLFQEVHDWKKGISHNDYVTAIMPIGNFNVFEIKSRDVYINYGLIYTGFAKDYSSKAIYYNANERLIRFGLNGLYIDGKWEDVAKQGGGGIAIDFETNIKFDDKSEYAHIFDFRWLNIRYQNTGIRLAKKGRYANGLSINGINLKDSKMWGCKKFLDFQWGSNINADNLQLHDFNVLTKKEYDSGLKAISAYLTDSTIIYEIYDMGNNSRQVKGTYRHGRNEIEGNLKYKSNRFKNEFDRR